MTDDTARRGNREAWDEHSPIYQRSVHFPTNTAHYNFDIGGTTEEHVHLLGDLAGKRVLELGCGAAQNSIVFAAQGATAIGVDFSKEQLAHAKQLADQAEVKVELHLGDLADLAFLQTKSIDLVFSAYAFGYVSDIERVFRQANRVLKPEGPLVFSLEHPASWMFDESEAESDSTKSKTATRSYFDRSPNTWRWRPDGLTITSYPRTLSDLYMALLKTGFSVDTIIEPKPEPLGAQSTFWHDFYELVPPTLIVRARKEAG